MERSRMPDNASSASTPVRLLPVVSPQAVPDFPGTRARRVCANCPVRVDCLEYAIAADEWGIWGGLDREQRRALRDSADEPAMPPGHAAVLNGNHERV
jgi:hypothetical protein